MASLVSHNSDRYTGFHSAVHHPPAQKEPRETDGASREKHGSGDHRQVRGSSGTRNRGD